jgi:Holliday junction DNA helicase RuvA
MQVMSNGPVAEIARAIEDGEVAKLTGVPGVGSKTAQKIILELRGKLADSGAGADMDVIDARRPGYQRNALRKRSPPSEGDRRRRARLKASRNLSKR